MPTPTQWDLSPLLASDADPSLDSQLADIAAANRAFAARWKDRADYLSDPAALKEALDDYERLNRDFGTSGKPGFYFSLRSSQDLNDPAVKAAENKVDELATRLANELQFFENALARVTPETQARFLADPGLAPYRHFLERLFAAAAHLLSDPEEKIMNLKAKAAHENWARLTAGLYAKETRDSKGLSELTALFHSPDKSVRDAASAQVYDIIGSHLDVAEAEFNSLLGDKKVNDELRRRERPESARHMADDIDTSVVDALVEAVSGQFEISRRFYALRAKLTGQDKLGYHERLVDLGTVEKKYEYEEASALVSRVFHGLDPEFGAIYKRMTENGQVDVYPRPGKRTGAFCAANLLSQPTYVLLNFTGEPGDVRTIAHEFGHAVNDELMRTTCNSLDYGTPLSTAEVASTFMEDFVRAELAREATEEERFLLMVGQLDDEMNTIFRQIAAYMFERELHAAFRAEGYLSKERIGGMFAAHMKDYLGDAVSVDGGAENSWASWPHFRTFFYVYSYASGLLISKALQRKVKADAAFLGPVKKFLSAGLSASPVELFGRLGLDIADPAFWKGGLEETAVLLEETEALAKKLGRI